MADRLQDLVMYHPDDEWALGGADREWLTYADLRKLCADIHVKLRALGFKGSDRIAIVLENGPDMAGAFFAIAQSAVTAPLNPRYREEEFKFYLEDLGAKAVVVAHNEIGPAVEAAKQLGLGILRLQPLEKAGDFSLEAESVLSASRSSVETRSQNEALILHTSGTTSRPKIVPLTHENLVSSAKNISRSLKLAPSDCCLNVMPLFHIHGLVAAVCATFAAGGSVWCSAGFDALKFFGWMDAVRPTWYTAVPTMHQAILTRAERNADIIAAVPLRFLRSSSASLPPQVKSALENQFAAPVIEAYGMTEAAHQMCCNKLDWQKPGSVGVAAGPNVAIAHETENQLISDTGEVVISGANVTPGYESNPEANAKNFFEIDGVRWFRTGDQGKFDEDGFLHLTGRLKEIINRGGEKISPLEIDEVLMDHPAVVQVVTFALPHPKLGEEVAAAVVLKDGHTCSEADIRKFASERVANFKVPRRVVILDEIPKGATGKMQRVGMAEKLNLV